MNSFFYSNLCHVCKKPSVNLKRCSLCKLLAYCSKEHQKSDWKNHQKLCKVITATDQELFYEIGCSYNNFQSYKLNKQLLWQNKLNRVLEPFECQMWMFPRVCNVCYSKDNLEDCKNCLNVSYCSPGHKQRDKYHLKNCQPLKLCMSINCYLFDNQELPVIKIPNLDKTVTNNLDFCIKLALKSDISPLTSTIINDQVIQHCLKYDVLAPGATIIYALEKSLLLKSRSISSSATGKLLIHIVGANNFEICLNWIAIFELLFHWIVNLKDVEVLLIGPELDSNNSTTEFVEYFCENCQGNNFKTTLSCHKSFYNDFLTSKNHPHKPDVVIAFNSGLHEFKNTPNDTWGLSLTSLLRYTGVPLVLTAYTLEEIHRDLGRLRNFPKVEIVLEAERNPFSNVRPLRDWEKENDAVFYVNGYVAILEKHC